eukprot:CAMPEP_0172439052 /NCGR_PEP_ID=MMETSP1065-20121228/165_1 /TAXON_ID=265537 /ORGANISM="Amphiprora paludosa, Strain CCMP125" /LENGTH=472 /DNA_ID=CAMNT_0013187679 /DNA_START=111 /DNA_END=1529 /DNA_ORIENTATION=-
MSAFNDPCIPGDGVECRPYGSNVSDVDPDRLIRPFEGLNYTGCAEDMILSDFDGDGKVSNVEYQSFVAKTAARRCVYWPELDLGQRTNFISLACQCASHAHQGGLPNCCVGKNAHLSTGGAANPLTRTEPQQVFIQNVCVVTYGTLPGTNCSLKILPVLEPPPIVAVPLNTRSGGSATGNRWTLVAAMIATLLLLLLICCCCCVMRRRKRKEYEEEEIIETEYPGKEEWLEQPLQEQAPRSMPPPEEGELAAVPVPLAMPPPEDDPSEYSGEGDNLGGGHDDDEDSDGEGRRRRGGNYVDEEEEDTRRRWPGGTIPDEEKEKEQIKLKPIPPKDPAPDDPWDEPGRNIEEIKPDPDEMSAQEFERYDPGGGVNIPQRPEKEPLEWDNKWEKGRRPEGDEYDDRKHRIQAGMGHGEIWDKLDQDDASKSTKGAAGGDAFDWVVQSAMNVMDNADEQGHLEGDDDSTVPPSSQN